MRDGVIRNAKIVTPEGIREGDLFFADGKITEESGTAGDFLKRHPEAVELDAEGAFAVPGGIDPHVHFGGFGDIPIADDFGSGSAAALAGGTTTVIDFAEPAEGESVEECIARRKKDASKSMTDYAFRFVLTKAYREQLKKLPFIYGEGIRDFKLFTVYAGEDLTPEEMEEIFQFFAESPEKDGITFLIHSEAEDLLRDEGPERMPDDAMISLARSRPVLCEREAVTRIASLAEKVFIKTGKDLTQQICIAHVSAGSTAALGILKKETCPHYLAFDESRLEGKDGALFTMTPPLRSTDERDKLRHAVRNGSIDMLSTDHCPYLVKDKSGKSWRTVPCGVDGVETRMLYLFTEGVLKNGMPLRRFVSLTSQNAAEFYHLYPRKGCLLPGSDADIALIEETQPYRYSVSEAHGKTDYSIYEGTEFRAKIKATVRGGELVYDGSNVLSSPGSGHFIRKY